jgi:hypothetical protein
MKSEYFGKIEKTIMGISAENKYKIPYFEKEVSIHFGLEYDNNGKEIETLPTEDEILVYEHTLKNFLENINEVINQIKEKAFKYFKEKKEPYGYGSDMPLISNASEHFKYMMDLLHIRILNDKKILLSLFYEIDEEHGMEILLKDNNVYKIDEAGGYVLMNE